MMYSKFVGEKISFTTEEVAVIVGFPCKDNCIILITEVIPLVKRIVEDAGALDRNSIATKLWNMSRDKTRTKLETFA